MKRNKRFKKYNNHRKKAAEESGAVNDNLPSSDTNDGNFEYRIPEILKINNLNFYQFNDFNTIMQIYGYNNQTARLYSLDKLLERDKQREKDGFPRKVKLGKLVKPTKDGSNDRTIIIPTIAEEKFYHWKSNYEDDGGTGGTGDGEEGEVIGEEPLSNDDGDGQGAGHGKGGQHGLGADAYDIGRILTEQFELPNIKEKGKRTSLTKYTYDLTDKNRGHGQLLDKKSTLKRVVKTNLALGFINPEEEIDTSKIVIAPSDRVYRTFSKERDFESRAIVFFVRDYSGSMQGKPTEAIVTQHIYINSWLVYQYKRQVISRFILHDTEAEEVPDFYTYYNKQVAGGTDVASAYMLVNQIVEEENLAKDFNIYIFHGTDGDDWDSRGEKVLPEIEKMLGYSNRIGITVASSDYTGNTSVEKYIKHSKYLENFPSKIRMDVFRATDATEDRIIEGIRTLIK